MSSPSTLRLLVLLVSEFNLLQHAIVLLFVTHRQCGTIERMTRRVEALKSLYNNVTNSKPEFVLATVLVLVLLSSESVESGHGAGNSRWDV